MIPSLPIELVQLIIQLNIGQFKLSNFRQRYNSLLQHSLVSQIWRNVAQEELERHIALQSAESVSSFVEKIAGNDSFGKITKSLAFTLETRAVRHLYFSNIPVILSKCENLEEIWFVNMDLERLFAGNTIWSNLTRLHSLHLVKCHSLPFLYETSFDQLFFPTLSHLSIIDVQPECFPSIVETILCPTRAPLLTSLALICISGVNDDNDLPTLEIPLEFARVLKKLVVYDSYGALEEMLVSNSLDYETLELLVIRDINLLDKGFVAPSSLLSLYLLRRIYPYTRELAILEDWINESENVVKQLGFPLQHDIHHAEDVESVAQLISCAKTHGIDLDSRIILSSRNALDDADVVEKDWKLLMEALEQIF